MAAADVERSGELLRLERDGVTDWRVGAVPAAAIPLADAVACSSAFPPLLSPFELDLRGAGWVTEDGNDLGSADFRGRLRVTDGGVYDNLGLETAWKRCRTVLVSDAGGRMGDDPAPETGWARQTLRVLSVIDNQVRALRKRQVIEGLAAGARAGVYWGIRSWTTSYGLPDALVCAPERIAELAATPTRLARTTPRRRERLVNWGYAVTDAAIRRHVLPGTPAPPGFPYAGGI